MDLPDRLPFLGQQRSSHNRRRGGVQEARLRGGVAGGRGDPLQAEPPHRLAANQVQAREFMYRARLKGGPQVILMLQAKPGRSGKQEQEQNCPSLGTAF